MKSLSHVRLFATPWTVAYQAPLFMGFFQARVVEWIAISFSRVSSQPGIEPGSPTLPAGALPSEPPYSKQCSPRLPAQLASGGCGRLRCFSAGSYCWARNLWVLIIYLFFLPVMLPSEVPRLATDSPVRVFPGVWKLLSFLRLPSWDGSPSLPFVSLFIFYVFFPTSFRRQWAAFLGP